MNGFQQVDCSDDSQWEAYLERVPAVNIPEIRPRGKYLLPVPIYPQGARPKKLFIEGIPGAGKTALLKHMRIDKKWLEPVSEWIDNGTNILVESMPGRDGMTIVEAQTLILETLAVRHGARVPPGLLTEGSVGERSIWSAAGVFIRGHYPRMSPIQREVIRLRCIGAIVAAVSSAEPVFVYLDGPVSLVHQRCVARGHEYDVVNTVEYLEGIRRRHEDMFNHPKFQHKVYRIELTPGKTPAEIAREVDRIYRSEMEGVE